VNQDNQHETVFLTPNDEDYPTARVYKLFHTNALLPLSKVAV
jgi:hypothetical protein